MTHDRRYKVLVVDDEAAVLLTYRMILERQGYDVIACPTSRDAIAALEDHAFDGLLCDYSLEDRHTGFEVISAARERDAELPVTLLTGYATKETAEEAASQNVSIMFKPIEIEEFLDHTHRLLRERDVTTQA